MCPRTTSHPPEAPSMSSRPSATSRSLCSGSPSEPSRQRSAATRAPARAPRTGSAGRRRSSVRSSRRHGSVARPLRSLARPAAAPRPPTALSSPRACPAGRRGWSAGSRKYCTVYSDWLASAPTRGRSQEQRKGRHTSLSDMAVARADADASPPVLSLRGMTKAFGGTRAVSRRQPRPAPGRDPGAARPERRRQVDPDQDARRASTRRRRQHAPRRRRLRSPRRAAASPSSIRTSACRVDDRRREHRHRPGLSPPRSA